MGSASASATKNVSSTTRGVRVFRVVITYTSGTTANSGTVSISWRPITVVASSSPDDPQSGDASKRTVTLTATADAPSGASYLWQYWNAGSWTNIGSASTSNTKSVSSTTRGTRKYRVEVSHTTTATTAQSDPIYVTWDEWAIVGEMLTALQTAVTGDASYTTAQTALVTCMNGGSPPPSPQFTSFDDILSRYTGDTKTKMDTGGACASQATTVFNTVQTLSRSKLAVLKSGNTVYAALLETPHGKQWEARVGAPYIVKQFAYLLANQPQESGGASGASGSSTGLDCLPSTGQAPATLQGKLDVLNCLVFDTPHSFWVNQADELRQRINDTYKWLAYNRDWSCTGFPDVSDSVCRKHDLAYDSLQRFDNDNSVAPDLNLNTIATIGNAWNPRNKALADTKLKTDMSKYDCQNPSLVGQIFCIAPGGSGLGTLAGAMHWGLTWLTFVIWPAEEPLWPTMKQEIQDINDRPRFVQCSYPRVTHNIKVTREGNSIFTARRWSSWQDQRGCIDGVAIIDRQLCWEASWMTAYSRQPVVTSDCRALSDTRFSFIFTNSFADSTVDRLSKLELVIRLFPRASDIDYGGRYYKQLVYRWRPTTSQ